MTAHLLAGWTYPAGSTGPGLAPWIAVICVFVGLGILGRLVTILNKPRRRRR